MELNVGKWTVEFFGDDLDEPEASYVCDSYEEAERLIDEVMDEKPHVVATMATEVPTRGAEEPELPMDPTGIDCIERYEGGDS
jgi:hypothetical protein